jgi:hypothetical protein
MNIVHGEMLKNKIKRKGNYFYDEKHIDFKFWFHEIALNSNFSYITKRHLPVGFLSFLEGRSPLRIKKTTPFIFKNDLNMNVSNITIKSRETIKDVFYLNKLASKKCIELMFQEAGAYSFFYCNEKDIEKHICSIDVYEGS